MNKMFGSQFNYLTLPASMAQRITHTPQYIRTGTGKTAIRKIYVGQAYDEFEQQNFQKFKEMVAGSGIQSSYPDDFLYRFIYSYKFVLPEALEALKNHEKWLQDPNTFIQSQGMNNLLVKKLNQKKMIVIRSGVFGRDKMMRPSVVIRAYLLDPKKMEMVDFLSCLNTVFMIAQQYMFYPGHVENWIIMIDTNEVGVTNLPLNSLNQIIKVAAAHYPGNLEKLYILNPSFTLNLIWGTISAFIDERSAKKIQMVKKSDYKKMLEYFDPSQLEEQYGGTLPKVTNYWPPQSTIEMPLQRSVVQSVRQEVQVQYDQQSVRSNHYLQSSSQYQPYQPPFQRQAEKVGSIQNSSQHRSKRYVSPNERQPNDNASMHSSRYKQTSNWRRPDDIIEEYEKPKTEPNYQYEESKSKFQVETYQTEAKPLLITNNYATNNYSVNVQPQVNAQPFPVVQQVKIENYESPAVQKKLKNSVDVKVKPMDANYTACNIF